MLQALRPDRTCVELAWSRVFGNLACQSTLSAMQCMFEDDDYFESRQFPTFHKVVLGLNGADLQQLLELSTSGINAIDSEGRTVLSWAAARGDVTAVEQLLTAGSAPTLCSHANKPSLHWAAQSTLPSIDRLVANKADASLLDKWLRTPLIYVSCNHNEPQYILDLVKVASDVIDNQDCHQRTALGYAAKMNHTLSAKALLDSGADPNLVDDWGMSPLFEALRATHYETLKLLATYKHKKHQLRYDHVTIHGQTFLHMVALRGDRRNMEFLRQLHITGIDSGATDSEGFTAEERLERRVDASLPLTMAFKALIQGIEPPCRTSTDTHDWSETEEFYDAVDSWVLCS